MKNKEALEKGLLRRRTIGELESQGILYNHSISYPNKAKELQKAKTADILKHKIALRPDRQALVNRRILKDNTPGTSPLIGEKCNALTKNQLCGTLNVKLEHRPGSLELVEQGLLKTDFRVATLIRGGSINFPRVGSSCLLSTVVENQEGILSPECAPQPPPPPPPSPPPPFSGAKNSTSKTPSRSLRDETTIHRYGKLTFHSYRPASPVKPTPSPPITWSKTKVVKQQARELQQAELLNLEELAHARRKLGAQICQLRGARPQEVRQNIAQHPPILLLNTAITSSGPVQSAVMQDQTSPISSSSTQIGNKKESFCVVLNSVPISISPSPAPPTPIQSFTNVMYLPQQPQPIFDSQGPVITPTSATAATLPLASSAEVGLSEGLGVEQNHVNGFLLHSAPADGHQRMKEHSTDFNVHNSNHINNNTSLRHFEKVWLRLRQLQGAISSEMSMLGLNLDAVDGHPRAFSIKLDAEIESAARKAISPSPKLLKMREDHAELSALARLLIEDRLVFLDAQLNNEPDGIPASGSDLERECLRSYLQKLGENYSYHQRVRGSSLSYRAPVSDNPLPPTFATTQGLPARIPYWNNRYSAFLPATHTFPDTFQIIQNDAGILQQQQTSPNLPLKLDLMPVTSEPVNGMRHANYSIPANMHLECSKLPSPIQIPVWQSLASPTLSNSTNPPVILPCHSNTPYAESGSSDTQLQTASISSSSLALFEPCLQGEAMEFSAVGDGLDDLHINDTSNTEDLLGSLPLEEQSAMCADLLASIPSNPLLNPSPSSGLHCTPLPVHDGYHCNQPQPSYQEDRSFGDAGASNSVFKFPLECNLMDTSQS